MAESEGYTVRADELRTHATHLDALKQRFAAVKAASARIVRDDQAYGTLCGWIAGTLEARHKEQDRLVAYLEENIALAANGLRQNATSYEAKDSGARKNMRKIENDLPRVVR